MPTPITGHMVDFVVSQCDFYPTVTETPRGGKVIGYDHRVTKTENFSVISETAARYLLEMDLKKIAGEMERLIEVPLTANQFLALLDFVYSVGVHTFTYSKVLANLNQKEYKKAANQFGYMVYDGKERSSKLIRRRAVEKSLFNRS